MKREKLRLKSRDAARTMDTSTKISRLLDTIREIMDKENPAEWRSSCCGVQPVYTPAGLICSACQARNVFWNRSGIAS